MIDEEDKYRLELIRDSLIGVTYHLPGRDVILFPFLDNLLLLQQAPVVFAFWKNGACVYSSLQDQDYLRRHSIVWGKHDQSLIELPGTGYQMSIHDFATTNPPDKTGRVLLPVATKATELANHLIASLKDGSKAPLASAFFDDLKHSIESRTESSRSVINDTDDRIDIDYKEVTEFLEPLRLALDDVFADSIKSGHLAIEKETLRYPRIFAVVRTCPMSSARCDGAFGYTAGMLLLTETKLALQKWCSSKCLQELVQHEGKCPLGFSKAEQCIEALEQPLGLHSRSVSDLVFSSGVVDFGRQANERGWDWSVAGDESDDKRRSVETCIYPSEQRLFYIPVHVGGTPWVNLFTFTQRDPSSDPVAWHHNYSFYRDLAQKAAALIRREAHDIYSELVAKAVVRHMKSCVKPSETLVQSIGYAARKLAQVYPFPLLEIQAGSSDDGSIIDVPGRGRFNIRFRSNPFFPCQVRWKLGDEKSIVGRCREAIGDFTRLERSIEINAVAQTTHLIKTPLKILKGITSSTGLDRDESMRRHVDRILELHDVACSRLSEKKRKQVREQHRRTRNVADFGRAVSQQYSASLMYLADPAVSGSVAITLHTLMDGGQVHLDVRALNELASREVIFFEPQVGELIDGLLLNAIKAVNMAAPRIQVRLATIDGASRATLVYIEVENSVSIDVADREALLRDLNDPGPDMVGITELHWMSETFWPDSSRPERLVWIYLDDAGPLIVAKALIAEVTK